MNKLSENIDDNIQTAGELFPIGTSFDLITRDLYLGDTRGYWIGINGFCKTEILQQIFRSAEPSLYEGFRRRKHTELYECQNRVRTGKPYG